MGRKNIDAFWDRNNLLNVNSNFIELYNQRKEVELTLEVYNREHQTIMGDSERLLIEAKKVNNENSEVQNQLNNLVIESGNANAEVSQARGEYQVLNDRLSNNDDKVNYITDRPKLNNGVVNLPTSFPELPFDIIRNDEYNYSHNATPHNQFNWDDATEIFMSTDTKSANDGLTFDKPVDGAIFSYHYNNGMYNGQSKFIFTIIDNVFTATTNIQYQVPGIKHLLIRSGSVSGKSILARSKRAGVETTEWEVYEGIYKLNITDGSGHPILDVINTINTDNKEAFNYYNKVNSIDEVKVKKGTFYQDGALLYCNPLKTDNVRYLMPITSSKISNTNSDNETLMFEDLYFTTDNNKFAFSSEIDKVYFFNCGFYRGTGSDGFSISGSRYNVYLFDCVSMYSQKDGFNYHSNSTSSLAVEVNCISYSNGQYKRSVGNQTTHSNNGSTAHDGMNILRVGSHYWDCEGPVVADVNDCYSISIGVKVGNILDTTTGHRDAFHLSAESGTSVKPKYVIECNSYGLNINNGINAPQGNAYYLDFTGNTNIENAIQLENWEV